MRNLNKVMLMGHLAADTELRQTKNGKSLATFPIAINRRIKTDDNEKSEAVDYHRVIVWGKFGEACEKYLKKGSPVYVEGKLVNHSFEDKEKNKHFRTEIVADTVNFLSWNNGKKNVDLEPIEQA